MTQLKAMYVVKALLIIGVVLIGMTSFRESTISRQSIRQSSFMADTLKIDAESGLVDAPDLMMIKSQCTACHSSKLILQHRFTRAGWTERIRWMQKYHKLWDLGESEKVVLDYLEKYYGPSAVQAKAAYRRTPLKDIQWYKLD